MRSGNGNLFGRCSTVWLVLLEPCEARKLIAHLDNAVPVVRQHAQSLYEQSVLLRLTHSAQRKTRSHRCTLQDNLCTWQLHLVLTAYVRIPKPRYTVSIELFHLSLPRCVTFEQHCPSRSISAGLHAPVASTTLSP